MINALTNRASALKIAYLLLIYFWVKLQSLAFMSGVQASTWKKSFDRVEHHAIFAAIRHFFVDEGYIALIQIIYDGQTGTMNDIHFFNITRGVRQGDVLTTLLCNVVLDFAFCNWKEKLSEYGWKLQDFEHRDIRTEKLTNVRFAADIFILAKSKK